MSELVASVSTVGEDEENVTENHSLFSLFDLHDLAKDDQAFVEWLKEKGLIARRWECKKCHQNMSFVKKSKAGSSNPFFWCCHGRNRTYHHRKIPKCNTHISIRKNSWFEHSSLSLRKITLLTYMFVYNFRQDVVSRELKISKHTANDWFSICREVAYNAVVKNSKRVGGPGHTVEIEESNFGRKNEKESKETIWIFGGYDQESKEFFMVPIERRDPATVLPIIEQWVLPGSTILSHCLKNYSDLDKNPLYHHLTEKLSLIFKEPETGEATYAIKSSWRHAKASMPEYSRKTAFFGSYLAMHMFRNWVKQNQKDVFEAFLEAIVQLYNPNV